MEPQGEVFGYFPDNLLGEILSRVPVKCLLRFNCVSKHLKTLISSPHFKSLHLKNFIQDPPSLLMLSSSDDTPLDPAIHVLTTFNLGGEILDQWDLPITGEIILLPSQSEFNKLVCLIGRYRFYVCNPSTRRCIGLPDSPVVRERSACSFAYFPCRDEYVIVVLTYERTCEILTLSISNEDKLIYSDWKRVGGDFSGFCDHQLGIFANGVFYWVILGELDDNLLSFDVEKEALCRFNLPFRMQNYGCISFLLEMKGDVYIKKLHPWSRIMELWKMNNDQITWSKEYTISLFDMDDPCPFIVDPVYVNGDGEMLIFTGVCCKYYNPKNGIFREAGIPKILGSDGWGKMILHTDNMLLLGN